MTILNKLGLQFCDLFPARKNQRPQSPQPTTNQIKPTAPVAENWDSPKLLRAGYHRTISYDYHDSNGCVLFQVLRYENRNPSKPKEFRQRRPVGNGFWKPNLEGVPRVLYRLPELLTADRNTPIFIVEGEKDSDRLNGLGVVATTNPMGARKWGSVDDSPLHGHRAVVVPDNDDAGKKHADQIAAALSNRASEVRILELPGLAQGGDVSDWFEAGGTVEQLQKLAAQSPVWISESANDDDDASSAVPLVDLPGGSVRVTDAAKQLGRLIAATGRYFLRGGTVVTVDYDENTAPILRPVKPASLPSDFESVARLRKREQSATCNEATAKLIINAAAFTEALPVIRLVSPCPVLVERSGQLIQITGYDPASGILTAGAPADEVSLEVAVELLNNLLADFRFATPADRSRALAAFLTPALVFGNLLGGRAPVDLGEADSSQTGKGYRNKITAAIYHQPVRTITQKSGGVGSLEESFNGMLIRGANFICLDNVRGKINSPALESFLTEDRYSARVPYSSNVEIDPRRVIVMLTSNSAEITPDLANRSSCVRLLKQPPGYRFVEFPEGDIVDHVRANSGRFLGAMFAVVKAWHTAGKPQSTDTRHDFRPWARTLDWIVQNILKAAPLLEGHRETQERMANPALTWLRDVALAVAKAEQLDWWLRAHHLLDTIADADIVVPGLPDDGDLEDELVREKVLRAVGRQLGRCFQDGTTLDIDAFSVERRRAKDDEGRQRLQYRFVLHTAVSPYSPHSPSSAEKSSPCNRDSPHPPAYPPSGQNFLKCSEKRNVAGPGDKFLVCESMRGMRGNGGKGVADGGDSLFYAPEPSWDTGQDGHDSFTDEGAKRVDAMTIWAHRLVSLLDGVEDEGCRSRLRDMFYERAALRMEDGLSRVESERFAYEEVRLEMVDA